MDAQAEAARLAAARREALDAMVADLRARNAEASDQVGALTARVQDLSAELSDEEAQRLVEAEAAAALRARLESANGELTAMTMALEQERARAEETLTLLAAARRAEADLNTRLAAALVEGQQTEDLQARLSAALVQLQDARAQAGGTRTLEEQLTAALAAQSGAEATVEETRDQLAAALAAKRAAEQTAEDALTQAESRAALLATARAELEAQAGRASDATRQTEALNQQMAALRRQLNGLQGLLDESRARDAAAQVQLQSLGTDLNAALARVAAEERKRRLAEEELRRKAEAESQDLQRYRSEFFGRLRDVLGAQDGVRIEGDRFVFSSEVLFPLGEAELSAQGRAEVAKVAGILQSVADDIPSGIDWIIRVDGHTDDVPVRPGAAFADNWELSQARALSVVKYMIDGLGIAPDRLAANGFGQYSPINPADTPEARAQNRRIELKFTEK
jgi:chemotaxis protein MotB